MEPSQLETGTFIDLVGFHWTFNYRFMQRTSSATSPRKPKAQSSNGDSVIYVPRSFRGLVTVSSRNSSIRLPDALSVDLVTLSEMNNTRRCFMCHLVESSGSFLHPTETRLVRCSRTALSD
jgi:hypothetical protein